MRKILLSAAFALMAANSLTAQSAGNMVSAGEPAGIVTVLMNAVYDAELNKDSADDPFIRLTTNAYPISIVFYGCDRQTNLNCDSVQFISGLDRDQPWDAESAISFMLDYRFIAVSLDDEGDPIFTWDVFTGDGIPTVSFLTTVERFEDSVRLAADKVFAK
jgi:hypothetical protein